MIGLFFVLLGGFLLFNGINIITTFPKGKDKNVGGYLGASWGILCMGWGMFNLWLLVNS